MTEELTQPAPAAIDAWPWWEARRLRYNLALGGAGLAAYALAVLASLGFGHPMWRDWQGAASTTLGLGLGFLLLMGVANVCYLAGALLEVWLRPADRDGYRKRAFALGFSASAALPFFFPQFNFAVLIGNWSQTP